ncbi:MAG: hypothetical protein Q9166_005145 [cf. Caloplaca sp. 2 TL-2023]
MQLENSAEDDFTNTPTFDLTSDDAVEPQTWGIQALSLLGGGSSASATVSMTKTSSPTTATTTTSASPSLPSSTIPNATNSSPTTAAFSPTTPAAPSVSPAQSPSASLSNGTKAGISIGCIFCTLALIIVVLLFRNARRSRRAAGHNTRFIPKYENASPGESAEMNEGPYEVNGITRPNELHGTPRSELAWTPKVEIVG